MKKITIKIMQCFICSALQTSVLSQMVLRSEKIICWLFNILLICLMFAAVVSTSCLVSSEKKGETQNNVCVIVVETQL